MLNLQRLARDATVGSIALVVTLMVSGAIRNGISFEGTSHGSWIDTLWETHLLGLKIISFNEKISYFFGGLPCNQVNFPESRLLIRAKEEEIVDTLRWNTVEYGGYLYLWI